MGLDPASVGRRAGPALVAQDAAHDAAGCDAAAGHKGPGGPLGTGAFTVGAGTNLLASSAFTVANTMVVNGDVNFYIAAASLPEQQAAEEQGDWQTLLQAGAQPLLSGCGPCIGLALACSSPEKSASAPATETLKPHLHWLVRLQDQVGTRGLRTGLVWFATRAKPTKSAVLTKLWQT